LVRSVVVPGSNLQVKLSTQVGQPYNAATVEKDVRYLWGLNRFEDVRVEVSDDSAEGVDVAFHTVVRPRFFLHEIRLEPSTYGLQASLPEGTPVDRRRAQEIAMDARRQLGERGYPDATVDWELRPASRGEVDLKLKIDPGKAAKKQHQTPPERLPRDICQCLLAERREAERSGVLDFKATVNVDASGSMTPSSSHGAGYRVGRIQFIGHPHYTDTFLRRQFLLDEGQVFDEGLLRRSLARLNRTEVFEIIDQHNVAVMQHAETGTADVIVRLVERKRGSWSISGPVGPASLAGPLQGAIQMRLPWWATYAVSFSVFAFAHPIVPALSLTQKSLLLPVLALRRPYTAGEGWRSGFSLAPQIGWRGMAAGYGATQLQQRLMPLVAGERSVTPDLPVTVKREDSETATFCRGERPRLRILRIPAGFVLQALGTLSSL
jgi:hypothetical protein